MEIHATQVLFLIAAFAFVNDEAWRQQSKSARFLVANTAMRSVFLHKGQWLLIGVPAADHEVPGVWIVTQLDQVAWDLFHESLTRAANCRAIVCHVSNSRAFGWQNGRPAAR